MSRALIVETVVLALVIWAVFYFASLPFSADEAPIVVGASAIAVLLGHIAYRTLRRDKSTHRRPGT